MESLLGVSYYPDGKHTSTSAEAEEEQRFTAGVGAGGAFGNQNAQQGNEGIERAVWEFREEGFTESGSKAAVSKGHRVKVPKKHKEVTAQPAKSVYRFVDTSS
jgi:hypothetical protein